MARKFKTNVPADSQRGQDGLYAVVYNPSCPIWVSYLTLPQVRVRLSWAKIGLPPPGLWQRATTRGSTPASWSAGIGPARQTERTAGGGRPRGPRLGGSGTSAAGWRNCQLVLQSMYVSLRTTGWSRRSISSKLTRPPSQNPAGLQTDGGEIASLHRPLSYNSETL